MKEKIKRQLTALQEDFSLLEDDFFIIGAAGLLLRGVDIGTTQDIDLLVSERDAEKLKLLWKKYRELSPMTKEDHLFISNFSRYKFDLFEIEVMGELKVFKDGNFQPVKVHEYTQELLDNIYIKIPTIKDFIRILAIFGREKDKKKIKILEKIL